MTEALVPSIAITNAHEGDVQESPLFYETEPRPHSGAVGTEFAVAQPSYPTCWTFFEVVDRPQRVAVQADLELVTESFLRLIGSLTTRWMAELPELDLPIGVPLGQAKRPFNSLFAVRPPTFGDEPGPFSPATVAPLRIRLRIREGAFSGVE